MNDKDYRFGINVIGNCKSYEKELRRQLESGADAGRLLTRHLEKLRWLQHERLIHLIVTALTSVALLLLLIFLQVTSGNILVLALFAILLVLTACYLIHYFRLENTVQRWYVIADRLYEKCDEGKK